MAEPHLFVVRLVWKVYVVGLCGLCVLCKYSIGLGRPLHFPHRGLQI